MALISFFFFLNAILLLSLIEEPCSKRQRIKIRLWSCRFVINVSLLLSWAIKNSWISCSIAHLNRVPIRNLWPLRRRLAHTAGTQPTATVLYFIPAEVTDGKDDSIGCFLITIVWGLKKTRQIKNIFRLTVLNHCGIYFVGEGNGKINNNNIIKGWQTEEKKAPLYILKYYLVWFKTNTHSPSQHPPILGIPFHCHPITV